MFKDSSTKYYQKNKEKITKRLLKDVKVNLKNNKKRSNNMVVNDAKIYQKTIKNWLKIKNYHK